ncbi:MAG: carboxypeptidase-like regulatory domain-containing protein [Planctomycetota bacterium]|nr:carboxypeptidase-like regulatory domain-containing protein [Planctomycetota bacterium]
MKLLTQVRRCLIVGATLGLLIPQATFAGQRNHNSPIRDVALQQGGALRGAILSAQGQHAVGQTISLSADGEFVAKAVVGTGGKFTISGLRPGVYTVVAGETQNVIRLWSETAAPPAATPELLLVEQDSQIVRGKGKGGGSRLPEWNHPLLVGGLLGATGLIGGVIGYNIRDFDPAS